MILVDWQWVEHTLTHFHEPEQARALLLPLRNFWREAPRIERKLALRGATVRGFEAVLRTGEMEISLRGDGFLWLATSRAKRGLAIALEVSEHVSAIDAPELRGFTVPAMALEGRKLALVYRTL